MSTQQVKTPTLNSEAPKAQQYTELESSLSKQRLHIICEVSRLDQSDIRKVIRIKILEEWDTRSIKLPY